MSAKMSDVAKLAGVSPTTVSRVINRHGYLSQSTIDKVEKAMAQLDYQPSNVARALQGKRTKLIGVIVTSVQNPLFAELIEELERALYKKGYKIILCNSEDNAEEEREYLQMLTANRVDGIITSSHNLGIKEYQKIQLPIVSFDRALSPSIPIVASDNYAGAKMAVQALINTGSRSIAMISGRNNTDSPIALRLKGYQDTLKANSLEGHVYQFGHEEAKDIKEAALTKIIKAGKMDAFFCTDDLTALMVYNIALNLGVRVPEDVQIIGYDGSKTVRRYVSRLSTVVQPIKSIATLLVELLLQRIDDPAAKQDAQYVLPVSLHRANTTR